MVKGECKIKNKVVNGCMNLIEREQSIDKIKLAEIKYALEGMYSTLSKTLIILIIAYFLGHFKDTLFFMLFYIPIRSFSFGFHANNSTECLILSIITFILLPWLFSAIKINKIWHIVLMIMSFVSFLLFSPAGTKKRPIKNLQIRLKCKIVSSSLLVTYFIISFFVPTTISKMILAVIVCQAFMISPVMYKLFKQPYYYNWFK